MKRTFIQIYTCNVSIRKSSIKLDDRVSDIIENIQLLGGEICSVTVTSHGEAIGVYIIDVLYEDNNGNNIEIRNYLNSLSLY